MNAELKLPRLVRDNAATLIEARIADNGAVSLSFSASSELPLERFFGTEILSHQPGAVRLERIGGGAAPLLFNHDWNDPIGMIDAGRLDGGRLIVDAHLFDTARAKEVKTMMDGGLRNVSIGYEINVLEENTKTNTYTATDWLPLEVSIVTVPADPSVGIGREHEAAAKPVQITRSTPTPAAPAIVLKGQTMSHEQNAPAGASAENSAPEISTRTSENSLKLEELRVAGIRKIAKEHRVQDDVVKQWVAEGYTVDDAARCVLDLLLARSGAAQAVNPTEIGLSKKEASEYSTFKAIRAILNNNWSKAGLEYEAHKTIQQRLGGNPLNERTFYVPVEAQVARKHREVRDMTVAGVSGSNYLVGTENMSFIDLLRNRSVLMLMGATKMGGLVGNVTIPRATAQTTSYWLTNEGTAITEGQPTIGQLSLSPKHVGAYTEISRLLALQSSPDAEMLVMNDLAKSVATAADLAGISGTGAPQPQGIIGTAGVGAVTGTSLAFAGVLESQTDIANALSSGCGYVTTPAVAALLMQRVKVASTWSPLWEEGNILDGKLAGFRAMSSPQMTAATMIFGDWSQIVMAEWGSLAIEVNPYANFPAGLVGVRALYAMDIGLRIPGAFSVTATIT